MLRPILSEGTPLSINFAEYENTRALLNGALDFVSFETVSSTAMPLPRTLGDNYMWRAVVDVNGRPELVQNSRQTVRETCERHPYTENCRPEQGAACAVQDCIDRYNGDDYNGIFRGIYEVPQVIVLHPSPTAMNITTRASEGMSIYGHISVYWDPPNDEVLTRLVPYDATYVTNSCVCVWSRCCCVSVRRIA